MSLLEKLMKPLLDAQYEKGAADTSAKHEAWKARQESAGVVFVPDPEDSEKGAADK